MFDKHQLAWRLTGMVGWLGLALVPAGFFYWHQQANAAVGLAGTIALAAATVAAAARSRRHLIRCPRCKTHLMDFTDVYALSFEAQARLCALEACPRCGRSLVDMEAGAAEDALRD